MIRTLSTLAMVCGILSAPAFAQGDATKGERVFRRCMACHQVGPEAISRVGPALNGIVDAAAGGSDGFRYSRAMTDKAAEGLIWNAESLTAFLTKPRDFVPGTAMSFAGLRRDTEIADVIAYLATFNADGSSAP